MRGVGRAGKDEEGAGRSWGALGGGTGMEWEGREGLKGNREGTGRCWEGTGGTGDAEGPRTRPKPQSGRERSSRWGSPHRKSPSRPEVPFPRCCWRRCWVGPPSSAPGRRRLGCGPGGRGSGGRLGHAPRCPPAWPRGRCWSGRGRRSGSSWGKGHWGHWGHWDGWERGVVERRWKGGGERWDVLQMSGSVH